MDAGRDLAAPRRRLRGQGGGHDRADDRPGRPQPHAALRGLVTSPRDAALDEEQQPDREIRRLLLLDHTTVLGFLVERSSGSALAKSSTAARPRRVSNGVAGQGGGPSTS
jgi:hypothetical protein